MSMAKFKVFDSGELVGELTADPRAANRAAAKMKDNGFTIEWVTGVCHCCGGAGLVMIPTNCGTAGQVPVATICGNCTGTGRER